MTFLAIHTALAWVTHSREWIPASIQIAGRFLPPVLNCQTRQKVLKLSLTPFSQEHPIQTGMLWTELCSIYNSYIC